MKSIWVILSATIGEILMKSFKEIFQAPDLDKLEMEPTRMLIMNVDGRESVGVFLPPDDTSQPWALHIRSMLVVLIQWQVVKTVLSGVEALIQGSLFENYKIQVVGQHILGPAKM